MKNTSRTRTQIKTQVLETKMEKYKNDNQGNSKQSPFPPGIVRPRDLNLIVFNP